MDFDILVFRRYNIVLQQLVTSPIQLQDTICEDEDCFNTKLASLRFCGTHQQEYLDWLRLLELYVRDVLCLIPRHEVKLANRLNQGWRQFVQRELNISKYMITKYAIQKYNSGYSVAQIVDFFDSSEF